MTTKTSPCPYKVEPSAVLEKPPVPNDDRQFVHRIYTENKNTPAILAILSLHLPGFTVLEATGFWSSVKEDSLVIEVIGPIELGFTMKRLATEIKTANAQESVLVTIQPILASFV